MELKAGSMQDRRWLEQVQFYLMKSKGTAFGLFMHRISVFITDQPHESNAPAFIGMRTDGTLLMYFHRPQVMKLSIPGAAELLKHEVLHVVYGHLATRGQKLTKDYGNKITNVAMDLVINQNLDMDMLEKEGLPGCRIEQFKFPPNLTTTQYCELLLKDYPDMQKLEQKLIIMCGPGQGTFEVFDENMQAVPDAVRDAALAKLVEETYNEAQRRNKDGGVGRGWGSGESMEFIASVKRKPQAPWHTLLRQLEGKHLRHEREINKKRPSRRHPAHWGRVRVGGLYIWCAIDTSGSMGAQLLRLVNPELKGIHSRGAVMDIIHIDGAIAKVESFNPFHGVQKFFGRGGTDFSEVFLKLRSTHAAERPAYVVFFTDGYGGIEQYRAALDAQYGKGWTANYEKGGHKCTPEKVDVVWVLMPNTMKPDQFRKSVCGFGYIITIPDVGESMAQAAARAATPDVEDEE